jgi:hypothetical protein
MPESSRWRRCSTCKSDIAFGNTYWVCSVSTCNRKRTGLTFCSVSCWDAHLPLMRHRTAWAKERRAPDRASWEREQAAAEQPKRTPSAAASQGRAPVRRKLAPSPGVPRSDPPREVLIIASKLKSYIRARSGMNTSERVLGPLSDHVRAICDRAIASARDAERKTVLDRDIPER